jgi:WD40 repeat protein
MILPETSRETSFYVTGGTLPPDASSYVERQADTALFASLCAGETCYVLNSRQMGKSSLCVRTLQRLKQAGVRAAFCDLTKYGGRNLSAEQWYAALLSEIGRELGLRGEFLAYWKANAFLPPVQRLFGAIADLGLATHSSSLVIFFDEIDVTLSLPFSADEFFAAIRQCYVGRATEERLQRLSFCLLGTATPADLIQDTRVSPFNIGTRIELQDFTLAEAEPLAAGLAHDRALLARVLYWTGGHPYLTQRLCRTAQENGAETPTAIDTICTNLFLTHAAKERDDNLAFVRNRLLKSEADLPTLLDLYRQMHAGKRVPDDETNPLCSILKLSGVAKVENGLLKVRNRIYAHVFDNAWVELHQPDAERRRQAAAYRRGVQRTLGIMGLVIAVMAGLSAFAFQQRNDARRYAQAARQTAARERDARNVAERNLYFANMNVIDREWENDNFGHVVELLEAEKGYKDRGFEWGYWNRLFHLDLLTIKGHSDGIFSVAYSPDGKRIVTGSFDKTAKVWDVVTGREILTLKGNTLKVLSVIFSPDGKRIVTAGEDTNAKVWDAQTGRELLTLKGHSDPIFSVAYSPDGKRIATGSGQYDKESKDKTVRIWDAATGQELLTLKGHSETVFSVAFSPDGKRIATGSRDKTARVWDAATGRELLTFKGHSDVVSACAFSLDGKRIVTASDDRTEKVWDTQSGRVMITLEGQGDFTTIAYSPDGTHIAGGSADGIIKVWDAQTGKTVLTLKGHTQNVFSVAYSPDSKHIVSGSWDKTAKIWDAQSGRESLTVKGHPGSVDSIARSRDGRRIAVRSKDNAVVVYDAETGRNRVTLKGHTHYVTSIAFSPDGKRIVTGSWDKTAKVWDAQSGRELLTLEGHIWYVVFVAYSADGKHILTGGDDGTAKVWDATTGREMLALKGHTDRVNSVAFSPDSKRIVTGSKDKTVKVWDAATGRETLTLKGNSDPITTVAFSADGAHLVARSADNTTKVWISDPEAK